MSWKRKGCYMNEEMPRIDLEELALMKEQNIRERRKFIHDYVDWLKKTPNDVWSKQHADFINSQTR